MNDISFNSSVVRLVASAETLKACEALFQFQCGAIGRAMQKDEVRDNRRFNSSVVRLVVQGDIMGNVKMKFQFQCGAIGRQHVLPDRLFP